MRILVVDDIGYSRLTVELALKRLGHEVLQATSGHEGLSILRNDHGVDAVITDLIMDDMDGVDLFVRAKRLGRVNEQGQVPAPPFILLTCAQPGRHGATSAVGARLKIAEKIGFVEILFKPVNPKAIAEVLNRLGSDAPPSSLGIAPLIEHLKEVTQGLIRDKDAAAGEKLKRSLEEHARLLSQLTAVGA